MNFKIDIYQLQELGIHESEKFYFGSLTGQTNKDFQYLINLFHYGKKTLCIEGLSIVSFKIDELTIIELTGFLVDGEYLKNIAVNSKELKITNQKLDEPTIQKEDNSDFIIIGDDQTYEIFSNNDFEFLKEKEIVLIESQNIAEWGASGFFENYIINVLSNFTSSIIEKLISIGIPENSISKFKLPNKVKNVIAKEYNVKQNSLFLESYQKDNSTEYITYRNIYLKVHIVLDNGELISLDAEDLNKYL
ncbi:hypothetical protein [uncultured Chryseobacterium sp.]|uniref:hypothetical protein n=1 Tax=uncultured Chryseobacterium sp. TaxID=259322 RepID=UPI0025E7F478|nr:hypothetical protein [uncultured Chryseobacterium sp.]